MSIASIANIKGRIKVATKESPIAVFVVAKVSSEVPTYSLDAVFADTITARERMEELSARYVGTFHGENFDNNWLEKTFRTALTQARNDA